MKCLVTGGAGFIGSHLCERLVTEGHDVTIIDDFSCGRRENIADFADQVRVIEMNITDDVLYDLFDEHRFDAVFHFAAQKNLRHSIERPFFDADINVMGSIRLLEAAAQAGTQQFIFASTGGALYGEMTDHPFSEDDPAHPLSPYAINKRAIEHYLEFFSNHHALTCSALRYANVYGPRQDAEGEAGVVAIFIDQLRQGGVPHINGNGSQTRDFIHVDDVIDATYLAFEKKAAGIFNIGTGIETSINDLFSAICRLGDFSDHVEYRPAIPGELLHTALNSDKAKGAFGFESRIDLTTGIQKLLESV